MATLPITVIFIATRTVNEELEMFILVNKTFLAIYKASKPSISDERLALFNL